MAINLQKAEFILSAAAPKSFQRDGLPQVAFAGRSNVGKSSVINRLLNRKNFARVGAAPGKTIHINYQYFTAMNIRFAHEIKGVADKVLPYLYQENELKSTLLVSLPGCGKTTLLRELVRKISNGSREHSAQNVSLIDERSEIASCYLGMAQNDVGMHTDILDACPKADGMLMVLRSMSPQIIAVDELGGEEDYKAIQQAFYLGCRLLATIHGTDYDSIKRNPYLQNNLGAGGFERLIFLKGRAGKEQVIKICNEKGEVLELC